MNVIVSNKYQEMLTTLDIDIIKSINGEFSVDELISNFSNFFFNKMILDITAIKNYNDINNLQKLSMALDMSKVILLLDDSSESSTTGYLSKLISMGIYNFTKSIDNIKFLIDNPNSYKDVAQYHKISDGVGSGFINTEIGGNPTGSTIIGFHNLTDNAGATTLVYMLKKQLERNYRCVGIELNKKDFIYFDDKELISTTNNELSSVLLKANNANIILLDLNDGFEQNKNLCNHVIYLIEPTTIKLNKMIRGNKNIFEKLKGQKIVLNKSLLESKDIADFEFEANAQVFYNIPPLDEKIDRHKILDDFIGKLGFIRGKGADKKGLFRK